MLPPCVCGDSVCAFAGELPEALRELAKPRSDHVMTGTYVLQGNTVIATVAASAVRRVRWTMTLENVEPSFNNRMTVQAVVRRRRLPSCARLHSAPAGRDSAS
ncbi:hypothetical protein EON68_01485 [archaeon]|nr:MAG: hypothetical protein EON68_01485 [archaeon]